MTGVQTCALPISDLGGKPVAVSVRVTTRHAEQDDKAGADLCHDSPVDRDVCLGDALANGPHVRGIIAHAPRGGGTVRACAATRPRAPATRLEVLARAAPPGWGCFTHHPLRSSLRLNCARGADTAGPNLRRLLGGVRPVLVLVEVEDARRVVLVLRAEGARQLVVAVRLRLLALLLEGAAERVVGVVVVR